MAENTRTPAGLSAEEAARRLLAHGPNDTGQNQTRTLPGIVRDVLREPMFLLLLGAGTVYLAMGDTHEALVLLGFVVLIMGLTVLQERRTDRTLSALRDLSSPRALVLRDGTPTRIPGRDVVVDDILLLSEGDRIPADGRVLEAHELAIDESLLTGESVSVQKHAIQQGSNQVFAGTLVVSGQAVVQVTATGAHTELGRIGKSLSQVVVEPSPLRKEIVHLTHRLMVFGLVTCAAIALTYWALRGNPLEALLAGITLAMGILPQEFAVIMIVFFALGARRMAAQQVLTRRLNAIETLGQTTTLCVDKTGTLTQNRMTVAALHTQGQTLAVHELPAGELPELYHELLEYAVLGSEITPHDPMEQAFHALANTHFSTTGNPRPGWALVKEYELSPALPAMTHVWEDGAGDTHSVATKGAPEAVASLCRLDTQTLQTIGNEARKLAEQGLRVLGIARGRHVAGLAWPDDQHGFNLEWLGLVGLMDPLRDNAPDVVRQCQRAGIRVIMITGDHPQTARHIAAQAGITTEQVMTGKQVEELGHQELSRMIAHVQVFARVTPAQKLRLVETLKARSEIVAMTGDGVNDAPALKAAHIGIAMGGRGTDVAREAASLVLLNDDLASVVAAIKLGRRIYINLRQAMRYTLVVHVPIILLSFLPLLLGLPLLLLPVHIAFLELIIDPSCSIAFEAQEGPDNLMEQPPRGTTQSLLVASDIGSALWQGAVITLGVMLVYALAPGQGIPGEQARAMAFVMLVTASAALIPLTRARTHGWRKGWLQWPTVQTRVLGASLLALAGLGLSSPIAGLFGFPALTPMLWALAVLAGMLSVLVLQALTLNRRIV